MKIIRSAASGLGGLAVIAAAAACTIPPKSISIPAPCGQPVTTIFETNVVPCMPVAPNRLDVVLAVANVFDPVQQSAATVRCGGWGGQIIWQTDPASGAQRLVCRTTDPYQYGVWE